MDPSPGPASFPEPAPSADAPAPARPLAPPTQRGTAPNYRPPSVWPTVLGVICCVMGSVGALLNLWSIVQLFLMEYLFGVVQNSQMPGQAASLQAARQYLPHHAVAGSLGTLVAVGLIIASVRLLRRRRDAPRWLFTWAVAKLVWIPPAIGITYLSQQAQFQATPPGTPMPGFVPGFANAMLMIMTLWYAALPVFLFIWFARPRVKEDVAAW